MIELRVSPGACFRAHADVMKKWSHLPFADAYARAADYLSTFYGVAVTVPPITPRVVFTTAFVFTFDNETDAVAFKLAHPELWEDAA